MKYSRVALLLAMVLVGRSAEAWVLNSPLLTPYEKIVLPPLSSVQDSPQAKASILPSFWLADDVIGADGPSARAEEKSPMGQRLAALFCRGISLLKTTSRQTTAFVSLCWQQAIEYCRKHNPKVEAEKIGVDMRATLDDLVETIRSRYATNQNRVESEVRSPANVKRDNPIPADTRIGTVPDLIERLCAGYWPNQGHLRPWYCECAYDLPFAFCTNDEGSSSGPSMTTGLGRCAKKLVEDWGAAFRNTSHGFAQLNWTILLKDHAVDRAAGISMPATR
jgi:hypothetical protein